MRMKAVSRSKSKHINGKEKEIKSGLNVPHSLGDSDVKLNSKEHLPALIRLRGSVHTLRMISRLNKSSK